MRVLITGANGYIGSTLHNALKEKHEVNAVTRQVVDLTDSNAVRNYFLQADYFDVILHCAVAGAAGPRDENWDIMDNNLKIYYNLLQNRNCYTRLIHFGSGAETYLPSTPYGYSKRVIAKSILNQDNFYNIKIFGVFDENELETRFIKANILRYIKNEPMQIHQDKAMDFFYMGDLIKVVEYYLEAEEPPKEFDCIYRSFYPTLKTIASDINNLDDYKVEVIYQEEGLSSYISKYRDTTLPIEFIGLEQGIKNMYNKLKNESN